MNFICLDGKIIASHEPVLQASNRGFRYGDGLFETMKMVNGYIPLEAFHFARLFAGLELLQYQLHTFFTREVLLDEINKLCRKNRCEKGARVRLTVYRGNGGLYDENKTAGFLIECWPLEETADSLNEKGLIIGIYPYAAKSTDRFSNLKSANFLPYSLAALHAKANQLDECLVLNTKGNIADGTITNLFTVRAGTIFTPALGEGCVSGVMRKYLVEKMKDTGYDVQETALSPDELAEAEEVFLSNAVQGIKWVRAFGSKHYPNVYAKKMYDEFVRPLSTDK